MDSVQYVRALLQTAQVATAAAAAAQSAFADTDPQRGPTAAQQQARFARLMEQSSLGTPAARRLRARISSEEARDLTVAASDGLRDNETGRTVPSTGDPRVALALALMFRLPPREREATLSSAAGASADRIAETLGISRATVAAHRRRALQRMGQWVPTALLEAAEERETVGDIAASKRLLWEAVEAVHSKSTHELSPTAPGRSVEPFRRAHHSQAGDTLTRTAVSTLSRQVLIQDQFHVFMTAMGFARRAIDAVVSAVTNRELEAVTVHGRNEEGQIAAEIALRIDWSRSDQLAITAPDDFIGTTREPVELDDVTRLFHDTVSAQNLETSFSITFVEAIRNSPSRHEEMRKKYGLRRAQTQPPIQLSNIPEAHITLRPADEVP